LPLAPYRSTAVAVLVLSPVWAAAQYQSHQKVALSGESAAGVGTFFNFQPPTVGPNGHVVFWATDSSQPQLVGIYSWDGVSPPAAVVRESQLLPGSSTDRFAPISGNGTSFPVDATGRTAFEAGYTRGSDIGRGIFTNAGGTLTTIALTNLGSVAPGTVAPGTGGRTFITFNGGGGVMTEMKTPGQVIFQGGYGISGPPQDGNGIFRFSGGTLTDLVHSGTPAPLGGTFSDIGAPTVNAAGDVAFVGALSGGGVGVYTRTAGGVPGRVARDGEAIPGNPSLTFSSFGILPQISDAGRLVFMATILDTSANGGTGIFTNADGTLRTVARTAVGSNPGTAVPRLTGETIGSTLLYPEINSAGRVTFIGNFQSQPGNFGLFAADAGEALRSVALPGDAAGGGTITNIDTTSGIHLNAGGQIAFKAITRFGTNDTGVVYLAEPDGVTLRVVAREGQTWDVDGDSPGTDTRTILTLDLADSYNPNGHPLPGTALNDRGQVALLITFDDNTSGVYRVQMTPVPEPAGILAVVVAAGGFGWWLRRWRS
jgi:hypothetical protein